MANSSFYTSSGQTETITANVDELKADAEKLAIHPEDSQFTLSDETTTGYSAKHHAAKAEDHKIAAETAKTAAETAKTGAETAKTGAEAAYNNIQPNLTNINTVAGLSSEITSLGAQSADITALADTAVLADMDALADITSDISNVATISSDVEGVEAISADVTSVAGIASDVTAVAGKATEIGRLGTAAAVADLAALGTSAMVADIASVADNETDISAVADNISGVNSFAERYRVGATNPTTDNDEGDLFYNSTDNKVKAWTGSTWENAFGAGSGKVDHGYVKFAKWYASTTDVAAIFTNSAATKEVISIEDYDDGVHVTTTDSFANTYTNGFEFNGSDTQATQSANTTDMITIKNVSGGDLDMSQYKMRLHYTVSNFTTDGTIQLRVGSSAATNTYFYASHDPGGNGSHYIEDTAGTGTLADDALMYVGIRNWDGPPYGNINFDFTIDKIEIFSKDYSDSTEIVQTTGYQSFGTDETDAGLIGFNTTDSSTATDYDWVDIPSKHAFGNAGKKLSVLGLDSSRNMGWLDLPYIKTNMTSSAATPTPNVTGVNAIGIGDNYTDATGTNAIAIGQSADATGQESVMLGRAGRATNTRATAIGSFSWATGLYSIALGSSARSTYDKSTALGFGAVNTATQQLMIGAGNSTNGFTSVRIGNTSYVPSNSMDVTTKSYVDGPLQADLDVNGNQITSSSNGDIDITPDGSGHVLLGNFEFDTNQNVGALQDDFVLTYDHSTGHISLEQAASGGGGSDYLDVNSTGTAASATGTNSIALGQSTTASGNRGVAIGNSADADGTVGVAIGENASAGQQYSVAIGGNANNTTAGWAVAIGYNAQSTAQNAVCIGDFSSADGTGATGVGTYANATAGDTVAIGNRADATSSRAVAIGAYADATNSYAIAIGGNSEATQQNTIAIGRNADAKGTQNMAIGYNANAGTYNYSVAIGTNAAVDANNQIAFDTSIDELKIGNYKVNVGQTVGASQDNYVLTYDNTSGQISLEAAAGGGGGEDYFAANSDGTQPTATGSDSIAIGESAVATNDGDVCIGLNAHTDSNSNNYSVAIGKDANCVEGYGVAVGVGADAGGITGAWGATAVGAYADATTSKSVGIGYYARATNNFTVAIGDSAQASQANATALGRSSIANGSQSTSIGSASSSGGYSNSASLGYQATSNANNTVTLGNSSITSLRCQDTTISAVSDYRDKTQIEDLSIGLDYVNSISPKAYYKNNRANYYDDETNEFDQSSYETATQKHDKREFGFIAQDVAAELPAEYADARVSFPETEAIHGYEVQRFAPADMLPILWKAVQELSAKNEALEARIAALENA